MENPQLEMKKAYQEIKDLLLLFSRAVNYEDYLGSIDLSDNDTQTLEMAAQLNFLALYYQKIANDMKLKADQAYEDKNLDQLKEHFDFLFKRLGSPEPTEPGSMWGYSATFLISRLAKILIDLDEALQALDRLPRPDPR